MPRKPHSGEAQEPKFLTQPQVTCNSLQTFPPADGNVGLETEQSLEGDSLQHLLPVT